MILSGIAFGQVEEVKMKHVDVDEVNVVPPKFVGLSNPIPAIKEGKFESFEDYLARNIVYPEKDAKSFNQGTEVVQFVISPTGELTDFAVLNSVCKKMDEEVIKVLKLTNGMWQPGFVNGCPAAMEKEVSVAFVLHPSNDFVKMAKSYMKQGNKMLFEKSNPKKALKYYDAGINLLPNNETLLAVRGLCKYELGDETGASRDWERISSLSHTFDSELLSKLTDLKGYKEFITAFKL